MTRRDANLRRPPVHTPTELSTSTPICPNPQDQLNRQAQPDASNTTPAKISPITPSVFGNLNNGKGSQGLSTSGTGGIFSNLSEASNSTTARKVKNTKAKVKLPPSLSIWDGTPLVATATSNTTSQDTSGHAGLFGSSLGNNPTSNLFGATTANVFEAFTKSLNPAKDEIPKPLSFANFASSSKKPSYEAGPSVSHTSPGTLGSMFFIPKSQPVACTPNQFEQLIFFSRQDIPLYSPEVRRLKNERRGALANMFPLGKPAS
jgi:hypothetical protein